MSTVSTTVQRGVLIAFGELFLKSTGVRRLMLGRLARTIEQQLKRAGIGAHLARSHDRFFIRRDETGSIGEIVRHIPGIAWFAEGYSLRGATLGSVATFLAECAEEWIPKNATYALALRRGAGVTLSREEIIEVLARGIERRVDLSSPDREILIEAERYGWFLACGRERGVGGLPLGSEGRVAVLLSGGIDSPVAAYLAAKRGAENVWIHFHSFPLVSRKSIEKVRELARGFLRFQRELRVHFVPLGDIQLRVRSGTTEKYRVLLYRRAMMKIAEHIARREHVGALVTGEALGQVGSQTLTNLTIVEQATKLPVLRPVIGFDKEEIIALARRIGTYEISIKPQEDCCSLFVPKHPTAAGKLVEVVRIERELALAPLIRAALSAAEIETFV
ncbi:MAG: tRNA uracil 4-sulfurtransferase ThiI [bacterium]|nr:tRNA uracil 4-sulfurtransferase ThiI [bacterium]MDZ4284198.1 tRNA uracil 4-sulfurtransferase ThiI [Patescibacteria group bacterium]